MKITKIWPLMALTGALLTAACGSKKAMVTETAVPAGNNVQRNSNTTYTPEVQQLAFAQKVSDTKVYAENVVSDMTFRLQAESKDISMPGRLQMRKDKVIRLQLNIPLLGTEVGRLEFTPTYVLVIDRLHKRYVKADYNQIDFLRDNGLSFYSLQALFWNQLFLPGEAKVSESNLKKYGVDLNATGTTLPVTLADGNLTYQWNANRNTGLIERTDVTYKSASHGTSTLTWNYDKFKNIGVKLFPTSQKFTFVTDATGQSHQATVTISLDELGTNADWEAESKVSEKYRQIEAQDILKQLMNF